PSSSPPGRRLSLFSAVSARCISCHGDRRDLHSFPTRRSSDLKDIQEVFQRVYHAGIKVKVITGDNADTTHAIARQAGIINHNPAVNGAEVLNSTEGELIALSEKTTLFTRMFPEAKLAIVNALKQNGEVVAMLG